VRAMSKGVYEERETLFCNFFFFLKREKKKWAVDFYDQTPGPLFFPICLISGSRSSGFFWEGGIADGYCTDGNVLTIFFFISSVFDDDPGSL
jgi:hypothetical protein